MWEMIKGKSLLKLKAKEVKWIDGLWHFASGDV